MLVVGTRLMAVDVAVGDATAAHPEDASGPQHAAMPDQQAVFGDRGYDHDTHRRLLRRRGIRPIIGRRGAPHGSGLGAVGWRWERTFAWLHAHKRLAIGWEDRADVHGALVELACCTICWRCLERSL